MTIQLRGSDDSVYSNDIVAPNLPTQGQIVGYQQGLWTPELASSDDTSVYTFTTQYGRWSRIGSMVTVHFYVQLASKTVSGGGVQVVVGMPYGLISADAGETVFNGSIARADNFTEGYTPSACSMQIYSGRTCVTLRTNNTTDTTSYLAVGPGRSSATAVVGGSITYETDDTTWVPINGATLS